MEKEELDKIEEVKEDLEKALSLEMNEEPSENLRMDIVFNSSLEINIETRPIKLFNPEIKNPELKEVDIVKKRGKKSSKCQEII